MKLDRDTLEGLLAALSYRKGASHDVLRQRMTEDMQVRNLSPHTQASYLQQLSLFARYFCTSPDGLTPEHIRTYQIYLTNEKKLATSSIHTAVAVLRFLYRVTLKKDWTFGEDIPLPKKPQKLPVVLSPEEVVHFLSCVSGKHHISAFSARAYVRTLVDR